MLLLFGLAGAAATPTAAPAPAPPPSVRADVTLYVDPERSAPSRMCGTSQLELRVLGSVWLRVEVRPDGSPPVYGRLFIEERNGTVAPVGAASVITATTFVPDGGYRALEPGQTLLLQLAQREDALTTGEELRLAEARRLRADDGTKPDTPSSTLMVGIPANGRVLVDLPIVQGSRADGGGVECR